MSVKDEKVGGEAVFKGNPIDTKRSSSTSASASNTRKRDPNENEQAPPSKRPSSPGQQQQQQPIVDNPCWGGPQENQHNLTVLIHLISTGKFSANRSSSHNAYDTIIIHNDKDFLVIDKPPDLRMDGDFPATVHKLTTYWFPPSSLVREVLQQEIAERNGIAGEVEGEGQGQGCGSENKNENQHENQHAQGKVVDKKASTNPATTAGATDEKIDRETIMRVQTKHKSLLLKAISKLKNNAAMPDKIIRTTHQLDYATSGVLLLAKSRKAAAAACTAFENRSTRKEYLSIVYNNIDAHSQFQILNQEQEALFQSWMDGSLENDHRKMRRQLQNRKGQTFAGYMPGHSVFAKWRGVRQRRRKRKRNTSMASDTDPDTRDRDREKLSGVHIAGSGNQAKSTAHEQGKEAEDVRKQQRVVAMDENATVSHLDGILLRPFHEIDQDEEEKIMDQNWKEIKQVPKYKMLFNELTKSYNDALKHQQDADNDGTKNNKKSAMDNIKLPTFFRVKGESEDAFYVNAPLGEDPSSFRVRVNSEALTECDTSIQEQYSCSNLMDEQKLTFKPSLTRCVVLKRGYWNGHPVTKMLLQPRTGRRHQLRLHMAILGSPILGDCTYEWNGEIEKVACDRMCLHAHKLSIPLGDKKMKAFVAPDPFVGLI